MALSGKFNKTGLHAYLLSFLNRFGVYMLDKLRKINIPALIFLSYTIKVLVFSPNYPDALVLGIVAAAYSFNRYISALEPKEVNISIRRDVEELKSVVSKLNLSQFNPNQKTKRMF